MKRFSLTVTGIMAAALVLLFLLYRHEKTERQRTGANQNALLAGLTHYKTKDSLNAVTIEQLTLTKAELKQHGEDLVERLKKQEIKIKRLESFTTVSTETRVEFVPVRKDSLVYLPGKDSVVYLKCLEYRDAWTDFTGCLDENNVPVVKLTTRDSIDIIGHVEPRNLWFIRYGVKAVKAEVINHNPNSRIKYVQVIKLRKKKQH